MIFTETKLRGAFIIDLERREDNRGFFARTFCQHEFEEHGLKPAHRAGQRRVQPLQGHAARDALPVSAGRGDQARALHARRDPRHHRRPAPGEPDVPRARRGRADRRQPPRALRARAVRATATRCSRTTPRRATRSASSTRRTSRAACAYDDPRLGLSWPLPVTEISEKDAGWPPLAEVEAELEGRMALSRRRMAGGAMIIVDTALRGARGGGPADPRRLIGAGFMAQGLANQIANSVPGMARRRDLRPPARAGAGGLRLRGARRRRRRDEPGEVEDAIARRARRSSTDDAFAALPRPSRSTCSST